MKFLKIFLILIDMIQDKNIKLFFGISDFNLIKDIKLLNGGKNNKVLKIEFRNNKKIVLKHYFFHKNDPRNRLKTEWDFLKHTQKITTKCVPEPIKKNEQLNMASYSYINRGEVISKKIQDQDIIASAKFIVEINQITFDKKFQLASESCKTLESHTFNINQRVLGLSNNIEEKFFLAKEIVNFIDFKIIPLWNKIKIFNIKNSSHINGKIKLFLSPSDFGFHNIIKNNKSKLFFIDFEYSGMDDLVKLSNDFFFSSGNMLKKNQYEKFLDYIEKKLEVDDFFRQRIQIFEFSYRLKWLCIMLNQYTKNGLLKNEFIGIEISKENHKKKFDLIKLLFNSLKNDFLFQTS